MEHKEDETCPCKPVQIFEWHETKVGLHQCKRVAPEHTIATAVRIAMKDEPIGGIHIIADDKIIHLVR